MTHIDPGTTSDDLGDPLIAQPNRLCPIQPVLRGQVFAQSDGFPKSIYTIDNAPFSEEEWIVEVRELLDQSIDSSIRPDR